MNPIRDDIYEFGPFQLDTAKRTLVRDGQPVILAPKALDVLIVLVRHRGEVLEKDQLMDLLWPDSVVEEANLPLNISALRKALGESPSDRRYILTVPGKGYKFAAELHSRSAFDDAVIIGKYSKATVVVEERTEGEQQEAIVDADRIYKTGSSVGHRRRNLVIASVVLAIGSVVAWHFSRSRESTSLVIRSIAVLPFASLGEAGEEALGIGMADVLITRLSGLREVIVRPTSAVLRYSSSNKGAVEIGRELGVDVVLEGTVQRSADRIRMTVRLLRVADGVPLWADKFDAAARDVFTLEDTISERVAERIALQLNSGERQALAKHETENPAAHTFYLKGRYQVEKRTPESARKAVEFFEAALKLDPRSALSLTGIAEAYLTAAVTSGMLPKEAFRPMKRAAISALEIDSNLPDAYTMLGMAKFWNDWDYLGAEADFKRALDLNPNLALPHRNYGHLLSNLGKHEEGLKESSRALEIDPMSLIANALRGQMLIFAGRNDEAIAHLRKSLEVEPNFWIFHLNLGKAYERKGLYSQAIAEFQDAWELSSHSPEAKSTLGYTLGVLGRRKEALDAISELKEMSTRRYVAPKNIALIYAGLGEKDAMFEWLERAYEDRDIGLAFMKVEPRWDPFRTDPRFIDLMHRVGF